MRFPILLPFLLIGAALNGCEHSGTDPEPVSDPSQGLGAALADPGQGAPDTVVSGFAPLALGASWEYAATQDYVFWDPASMSMKPGRRVYSFTDQVDSAWASGDSTVYRFHHIRTDSGVVTWDTTFICQVHDDSVFLPFSLNFSPNGSLLLLEFPVARESRAPGKSMRRKWLDGQARYFLSEGRSVPAMQGEAILVDGIGMVSGQFGSIPSQAIQGSSRLALRLRAHNGRLIPP